MQIHIHTDHHVEGHEALVAWATPEIDAAVSRHRDHITRIEVHLSDQNGHKGGQDDKRCVMEARLEGRQPLAVTHHGDTLYQAITGASDKLTRLIASTLGRAARAEAAPGSIAPDDALQGL